MSSRAVSRSHAPIYLLLGLATVAMLAVLGVEMLFGSLQRELGAERANEEARLFIGDGIVRGIQAIEKDLYRLLAASSEMEAARLRHDIDRHIEGVEQHLAVLQRGGTIERRLMLNIEGRDEMVQQASYRPPAAAVHVMELIEISPLLDKMGELADVQETLVLRRIDCDARGDVVCRQRLQPELDLFLKQLPSHIERTNENANRLFYDSNQQLRELETRLEREGARLKRIETVLVALVIILAGAFALVLLRRLQHSNERLEAAVKEMRRARDEAERASRAKSEFVSRMSHELRTPLNAIIGFADLLKDEPLSSSHRHYVGLINHAGQHLMELINAVLDHAKIEAGGLTLERIPFDFRATIDAVRHMVSDRANAKGLRFIADIAADLPARLVGDPTRLRQVLINLLNNAIKFTEQGSVELRVAAEEGRIVFSVRDTGIGMDAQALGRLFQPFSQADDSVTRKFGGTGLGLLISKELIEAMGGGIEVESAPGVGTAFWFWLPLLVAEPAAGEPAAAKAGPPSPRHGIPYRMPGRVLLVDDNQVNQELAGAMLDHLGLAYDLADDGAQALQRLAATPYALVLMDMEMPEMDGISATRALRDRERAEGRPRLPVVAMTANALQEDRERCFAAGMDGYIAKPVSVAALQAELQRLFGDAAAPAAVPAPEPPPVRTAMPDALYDRAEAIERMGDEGLFEQLAAMFSAAVPGYVQELEAATAAGDPVRLVRIVHTLKGLCSTFGATGAETLALEIEQAARAGTLVGLDERMARLRTYVEALAAALKT